MVSGVDMSRDITATMDVLSAFGASFRQDGSTITVTGVGKTRPQAAVADCCESGSTLRFLIPVAAALGVHTTFFGQGRLPHRPITAYLRELTKKGIAFEYHNTMPFSIDGALQSGVYELEGDVSSQYVTGLLFALPLLEGDSEIRMLSRLESKPYVDLTIACLRHFGVTVHETEQGYTVPGGQQYHACDMEVEGDYSQAAFFYVANALGSDITLTNLNPESVQGDKKLWKSHSRCVIIEKRDCLPALMWMRQISPIWYRFWRCLPHSAQRRPGSPGRIVSPSKRATVWHPLPTC